jgi:hypothetical protein
LQGVQRVKRSTAWLVGAGAVLVVAVGTAVPAGAIEVDPILPPVELPPPDETTTTLAPEPPPPPPEETTTTLPPPPPPDSTTTLPPTTEPPTTEPPSTTEPPTTEPPTTEPPSTTEPPTTAPPTTERPTTTNPPPPDEPDEPDEPSQPPTTPTTNPPIVVTPIDPDDVPVIVFPPKDPTALPPGTVTTVDDPDEPSGSTGTTGGRADDDPTTTGAPAGTLLEPKVAVKTIPEALGLVVAQGGSGPAPGGGADGPPAADVEGTGTARLVSASGDGERADEAAAPATRSTGTSRGLPEPLTSPLGGILLAALVSFVVAGSYCGWLLLGGRR